MSDLYSFILFLVGMFSGFVLGLGIGAAKWLSKII
jgi:hypothetical protein